MAESGIQQRRTAARRGAASNYEERRQAIIRAGATVFKERGYQGASLADIAEAVGTDRATLYYYVRGKAEIFDEAVTGLVWEGVATAEGIRDSDDPPALKLRRLLTSIMEAFANHYPLLYVYLQENLAHVEDQRKDWAGMMRDVNRRWEAAVQAIVQQGFDDGSLRRIGDARVIARGLIGTVNWTYRWFNPDSATDDATTIGAAYAEMVLGGLTAERQQPHRRRSTPGAGDRG